MHSYTHTCVCRYFFSLFFHEWKFNSVHSLCGWFCSLWSFASFSFSAFFHSCHTCTHLFFFSPLLLLRSRLPPFGIPLKHQSAAVVYCGRWKRWNEKSKTAKMNRALCCAGLDCLFLAFDRLLSPRLWLCMRLKLFVRETVLRRWFSIWFALLWLVHSFDVCEITHERTCLRCAFSIHWGLAPYAAHSYHSVAERKPYRIDVCFWRIASLFRFRTPRITNNIGLHTDAFTSNFTKQSGVEGSKKCGLKVIVENINQFWTIQKLNKSEIRSRK